jgi:hypothetical protein
MMKKTSSLFFMFRSVLLMLAKEDGFVVVNAVNAVDVGHSSFLGDVVCPGGQQHCVDDSTCCLISGDAGYMCCESTAAGPCCGGKSKAGGGCCSKDETCCSDDDDWECCIQQSTYCIAKDTSAPGLPSRCCPRWTVGCTTGSVGCCDPAQPWQWSLASNAKFTKLTNDRQDTVGTVVSSSQKSRGGNNSDNDVTAYVLVVNGIIGGLEGMTVNTATGAIETHTRIIKSFDDDPAGESTRPFFFDASRKVFYYVDANFTANGGARPAEGREMYLYTVDPVSGKTNKQTVSGAVDYPVGYSYHPETDTIIMGVEQIVGNDTVQGFDFFSLNPETAVATKLSSISRGEGESDPSFYAGFHRHSNDAADTVYRLGYEQVTQQTGQGLGIVKLDSKEANATWLSEVSPLHDFYMTLDRVAKSNQTGQYVDANMFVSLAPRESATHKLDLVQWTPEDGGKSATVIAKLDNAHVPSVMKLGDLGYLASAVSGGTFAALVVEDEAISSLDRWALAIVDLTATSNNSQVLPLTPRDIAGSISISGLGLA